MAQLSAKDFENFSDADLLKMLRNTQIKASQLKAGVDARKEFLGGPIGTSNFQKKIPAALKPSNVGDLSKIYWQFFFTNAGKAVTFGTSEEDSINITQEATFAVKEIMISVFKLGPNGFELIDTYKRDERANGLFIEIIDEQSGRTLMDKPISIDSIGLANEPLKLEKPFMFLPNSVIKLRFTNTTEDTLYVPFVTMSGYRMRIDNQAELLSLVKG